MPRTLLKRGSEKLSCEFCEIFKNTFSYRTLAASDYLIVYLLFLVHTHHESPKQGFFTFLSVNFLGNWSSVGVRTTSFRKNEIKSQTIMPLNESSLYRNRDLGFLMSLRSAGYFCFIVTRECTNCYRYY